MTPDRRRRTLVLLAGLLCLAGTILAWPWLRPVAVEPLALALWLLLRLFVLSLHQAVFWTALLLAAAATLVALLHREARLAPPEGSTLPRALPTDPVEHWRRLVERTASGTPPAPTIGWSDFLEMVVSLRALELRVPADHRLHDALRDGRVPLPPGVHAFLFPPPARGGRPGAHPLRWLRARLSSALHRLSGRDRAERLRHVSEVLSFLEDSLEMPSHDRDDLARHPAHR